ncbi:MAG: dephospho-CoA kinase [Actinomyces sp.]|nr:dephospho-CoA kinase [Actinomyces sp.]
MAWEEIRYGGARALVKVPVLKSTSVPSARPRDTRPLWIGLTGGIGAGKSAVTNVWREMGATVADGDVIARTIAGPGTEGLAHIIQRFGSEVAPGGVLNRASLASIVFNDEAALADLNEITHPQIRARALEILEAAPIDGLAVYDAAVLIEAKMTHMVDAVAVVVADEQDRVARLTGMRGMDEQDARRRIMNQMSDAERRKHASIIIENEGSLADLDFVARELYQMLTAGREA